MRYITIKVHEDQYAVIAELRRYLTKKGYDLADELNPRAVRRHLYDEAGGAAEPTIGRVVAFACDVALDALKGFK